MSAPRSASVVRLHSDATYYRRGDPDPVLEEVCHFIEESGLEIGEIIERVLDVSDNQVSVSYQTIWNWMHGKVRRPQNFTVTWVARALGHERTWRRRAR